MSNFTSKLYSYDTTIDLVSTDTSITLDNRPMNSRKLKVHKGVNNELLFSITNKDRKKYNVFADTLYAYIVSPTNKKRVVTKLLEHTSDVGVVKLVLTDGDLQNVSRGLYLMHIVKNDPVDQTYLPLFSDQQGNANMEMEKNWCTPEWKSPKPCRSARRRFHVGLRAEIYPVSRGFGGYLFRLWGWSSGSRRTLDIIMIAQDWQCVIRQENAHA